MRGRLRLAERCFIVTLILVVIMGCAPKRLRDEKSESVHLAHTLPSLLRKYQGVPSLYARLSLKVQLREQLHFARGMVVYARPERLRIKVTTPLGGTVGDIIFIEGFLRLILPAKGRAYCGRIDELDLKGYEQLTVEMTYGEYMNEGGWYFPTRIYAEVEKLGMRFELTLKDVQVSVSPPEGIFALTTGDFDVVPLAELWRHLRRTDSQGGGKHDVREGRERAGFLDITWPSYVQTQGPKLR